MANEEKELHKFVYNPKYREKVIARVHKERDKQYNKGVKRVKSERDKLVKSRRKVMRSQSYRIRLILRSKN